DWNTSSVTNMYQMFYDCYQLTSLDLSGWNTANVTNMSYMFYNCSSLKSLDISGFNTSRANLRYLFYGCNALEEITLGENFSFWGSNSSSSYWALLPQSPWKHSTNTSIPHYSNYDLCYYYNGATMGGTWVLITDYYVNFTSDYANAIIFTPSASYKASEASPALPEAYLAGYRFLGWEDYNYWTPNYPDYPAQSSIPAGRYTADTTRTLYAIFEPIGTEQEDDENTYTFTLKGGETATISDLPAGVKYEIWELTEEGWVLVEKTGDAGEIVPEATQTATFTNRYDPSATQAEITATKLLDGAAAEAGAFSFTLSLKSGPDGVEQEPITLNNGGAGKVTFGPIVYSVEGPYVYEIRENAEDSGKYSCDTHVETVKVYVVANATSGGLDAVVEYDTDGATFNNYTLPGTLTVTKAVTDDEITQANKDGKEFTFTVTLTDKYDRPLTSGFAMSASGDLIPTLVYPNGRTQSITSGSVTFTLKAGETATIRNLPEGTQYKVEETELPGGWSAEGSKSESGAITAGGSAEVTITNKYSTGSVSSAHVSFDAYKELVGAQLTAGAYEFELYEISGPDMEEGEAAKLIETVTNDGLIENEDDEYYNKYGTISFSEIEYGRLYGTADEYVYEIREKAGTDPTMQYSDNVLRYKVTVRDNGEGRLVTEVAHESGNEVFTNALLTGSLKVTKTVANATALAADKEFTFTLTIVDAAGIELSDSYDLRVYDAEGGLKTEGTIRSGGTVTLKGGESFVVLGLPHEAKYSVVEAETKGFRTSVTAEEKNDAERKGSGTITAGKESTVGFVNTYSSIGSAEASLRKVFVGGQITTGAFKFELREAVTETDDEGNAKLVPGEVIDTAYATTEGTIGFSSLDFTVEDDGKTFTYFITEVD
ncbi:MAG: BspA family leucine-rich repeat surface protein, partial [Oscillospiraceae bacterium]|nr:BspA family leucine-rich repeat surface protein [Oscillospiraceae bacterium]